MTNADTLILALDSLLNAPVNPFTEKAITDEPKNAEAHHIFYTDISDPW